MYGARGTLPPSEYFKRQCYLALDADEEPAVDVVEKLGADYFVVSTDYPHSGRGLSRGAERIFCHWMTRPGARSCGTTAPDSTVFLNQPPR